MVASLPAVLAGPALMLVAAVLVALAARGARTAMIVLILFAAADLGWYGLTYAVYPGAETIKQFAASADLPPAHPDARMATSPIRFDEAGARTGNQMTLSGWGRADSYLGLQPRRQLDLVHPAALRVAGVRWVKRTPTTAAMATLGCFRRQSSTSPGPMR